MLSGLSSPPMWSDGCPATFAKLGRFGQIRFMKSAKWQLAQRLELIWWKRYLAARASADYLEWKREYWLKRIREQQMESTIASAEQILDAGCGPAGIFIALEGKTVTAIDPLLPKYEAEIDYFNTGDYPQVTFKCVSLEDFDESATYDLIFCLNAINHVSDIRRSLGNLYDKLESGGTLLLSTDAHRSDFWKAMFRAIPLDALHPQQFDRNDYLNLLAEAGFELISADSEKHDFFFDYCFFKCRKPLGKA